MLPLNMTRVPSYMNKEEVSPYTSISMSMQLTLSESKSKLTVARKEKTHIMIFSVILHNIHAWAENIFCYCGLMGIDCLQPLSLSRIHTNSHQYLYSIVCIEPVYLR